MFKNLFVFFLFISTITLSQTEVQRSFTQGYVVLSGGDTLKGNLAVLSEEESCERVYFRKNVTDTVTAYRPQELRMYKREGSVYVFKPLSDKKSGFVKWIEKGNVNVYQYSYVYTKASLKGLGGSGKPDQSGPVEIKQKERPTDVSYEYYLEKAGSEPKKISRGNIRGELWNFFKGDDLMVKKVKETKIEYDEIPGLIKEYNRQH